MKFDDTDALCVGTIRTLAADVVQKSNSGHPGAPMGCAPIAHVLFTKFMRCNPRNPAWTGRDRFVLSNGHACVLQYVLLHLLGYDVSMDDLKQFRQLDSKTPGHPENHMTAGVEVTTGPLGQGFSNAVGLAIAESHLAATFNRGSAEDAVVDNYTYCLTGDGCLQEGIASEAASLAGHLKLGKLIVLYDDNSITIDGETEVSFTEDVLKRFEAYGWHTQYVADGDSGLAAIADAVSAAQAVTDKPSLIKIKTTIGFGSVNAGKEKVHGAALGNDDVAQVKRKFGFDETQKFVVPEQAYARYAAVREAGAAAEKAWEARFARYAGAHAAEAAEFQRRARGELPSGWEKALPRYTPADKAVATRKLSEIVLDKVADLLPELMGGSADLTASNLTRWKTAVDYQAVGSRLGSPAGRYLRFGVREHGMAAICNGMAAYGSLIPFGATFLNFIGYAQGAFRLSALSHLQVLYIMTHDSIGLGEDGPTHQPVEILPLMRATPNVLVLRPADGNEVSGAYLAALTHRSTPSVLCLSRQNLPQLEGSSVELTLRGAYVLRRTDGTPSAAGQSDASLALVLAGTGSEVPILVEAGEILKGRHGVNVNVVSMPSWELFEKQPAAYKAEVFPEGVPVLSLEAQSTFGWERYAHGSVGMTTFGTSGPYTEVYKKFGICTENVVEKAKALLHHFKGKSVPHLVSKPF